MWAPRRYFCPGAAWRAGAAIPAPQALASLAERVSGGSATRSRETWPQCREHPAHLRKAPPGPTRATYSSSLSRIERWGGDGGLSRGMGGRVPCDQFRLASATGACDAPRRGEPVRTGRDLLLAERVGRGGTTQEFPPGEALLLVQRPFSASVAHLSPKCWCRGVQHANRANQATGAAQRPLGRGRRPGPLWESNGRLLLPACPSCCACRLTMCPCAARVTGPNCAMEASRKGRRRCGVCATGG